MRSSFSRLLLGLLVLGLVAAIVPWADAQKRGGTLTIVRPTDPVSLDPNLETTAPGAWVYFNMLEGLLTLDEKMQVKPALAASYEVMSPTRVRFKLRPNVKFHDGTPFNAEAVKFVFERQLNDKGPYYATGTYPYVKGFLGNVAGVEVLDPTTVQIKLKAPLTPFLQYLAHQSLFMFSPESLKKWGKDVVKHPVGTGPFKLESWEPGVRVVLARNDAYWGGAPKIRQEIYVPIF